MRNYFGVDLGGTSAKVAVVSSNNKIILEESINTTGDPSPRAIAQKIGFFFKQMRNVSGASKAPQRIGVGVAGDIDAQEGIVRISPNLGWKNVPLGSLIRKAAGVPVTIDNDANVAAWGIYKTQVPAKVKNVIVVTLGTGVGGGLILNGILHRGATGSAGELGHMVLDEKGPRCNCGLHGCLEAYAGGPYMMKWVKELLKGKKNPYSDPKDLAEAAAKGNAFAKSVWNHVGHKLGVGLGNMIYILNPEMIFLAGGVSQARQLLLRPIKESLSKRPFQTPVRAVKIQIAKDPAVMGVIGAALL